jgi:hypothetical protein
LCWLLLRGRVVGCCFFWIFLTFIKKKLKIYLVGLVELLACCWSPSSVSEQCTTDDQDNYRIN